MLWIERNRKIEERAFEIIDDISEELGLKVSYYPEVYWVGRKLKFEELGISESYRHSFDSIKKGLLYENEFDEETMHHESCIFPKFKIILMGEPRVLPLAEECGHFIHLVNSNLKLNGGNLVDHFGGNTIIEMLGYFSSKLIVPERKNSYRVDKDVFIDENKIEEYFVKILKNILSNDNLEDYRDLIHDQGYRLGEKLFDYYISGNFSKKDIKKLFCDSMSGEGVPFAKFLNLKYGILK